MAIDDSAQYARAVQAAMKRIFASAAAGNGVPQSIEWKLNGRRVQAGTLYSSLVFKRYADLGIVSVLDAVVLGVAKSTGAQQEMLAKFGYELSKTTSRRSGMAEVNKRVASVAAERTLRSYQSQVKSRPRSDRTRGRLSGKMEKALSSGRLVHANANEIVFGDISAIEKHGAIHWRRLNFGAGSRGESNRPKQFVFNLGSGDTRIGAVHDPAPSFRMPLGVFLEGDKPVPYNRSSAKSEGGTYSDFYPAGMFPDKMKAARGQGLKVLGSPRFTRGIRGYQFFDAGIAYLARELPNEYFRLGEKWMADVKIDQRFVQTYMK